MNQQAMPWFDSDKAATKYAIQNSGKEPKDVAHALWPHKTVPRATTDLLNALNENREEQLSSDEHAFIANYCRSFEWLYYHCHKLMHSRPLLQTPAEVTAQLQATLLDKADELEGLLKQIRGVASKRVPA
jgi:hypothetical protein